MVPRRRRRERRKSPEPEAVPWQYHEDRFVCHASATCSLEITTRDGFRKLHLVFWSEFACEASKIATYAALSSKCSVFHVRGICADYHHSQIVEAVCKGLLGEIHGETTKKPTRNRFHRKPPKFDGLSLFVRVILVATATTLATSDNYYNVHRLRVKERNMTAFKKAGSINIKK